MPKLLEWSNYKKKGVVPGFGKYGKMIIVYDVATGRSAIGIKGYHPTEGYHHRVWLDPAGEVIDFKNYSHWAFVNPPERI